MLHVVAKSTSHFVFNSVNFWLGQIFLKDLIIFRPQVQIVRLEVWIINSDFP